MISACVTDTCVFAIQRFMMKKLSCLSEKIVITTKITKELRNCTKLELL